LNIKKILISLLAFISLINISTAQNKTPGSLSDNPVQLKKYVVDETGTLTNQEKDLLMQKLIDFEKKTSNQIVVYIIKSLNGEPIEFVSVKIAEANKIGKKDKNNGVLLLVAMEEKKIRIEVGYGLEGALTDAISSSIIRNEIAPDFKQNQFYEGINKGLDAIILATKNEYKNTEQKSTPGLCFGVPVFVLIIFVFVFFSLFMSIIRRIFGFGGRRYFGSGFGGFWGGWGSGGGSSWGGGGFGGFSGSGGSFGGGGASGGW